MIVYTDKIKLDVKSTQRLCDKVSQDELGFPPPYVVYDMETRLAYNIRGAGSRDLPLMPYSNNMDMPYFKDLAQRISDAQGAELYVHVNDTIEIVIPSQQEQ